MTYRAPLNELRFALATHGRLPEILAMPFAAGLDAETVDAILEEAGKFAEQELAPTNRSGDLNGARLVDGKVITHPDIANAFYAFRDAGWLGLRAPVEYEGQGLPSIIASACEELWCSANLAFSLLPMLTLGAIGAIEAHASDEQKQRYLPNMSQGIWSGTMNLTEPNAGSDLAQVATKAIPNDDGSYALSGQKIFITWGDHELTENVIHLVLARLPDAPAGVKGISLFIAPKYLINADGSLGKRNPVYAVSLEHKLGIHASPTCVMSFEGAEGYLVGEAGKGLNYMFTMMNHARLGVGIEGHAVAERAYQDAVAYAKERVQSRALGSSNKESVPIIQHPDVRRMLMVQKATLAAQRALYMKASAALDQAHYHPVESERARADAELSFLIPIVKSWCTDNGTTLTNLAMQVLGGMGYVEETGVAQYVRDVRITPIYEGTNGIQALDLAGRKTAANGGNIAKAILAQGHAVADKLAGVHSAMAKQLQAALTLAQTSVDDMVSFMQETPEKAAAGACAYLNQMSCTLGAVAVAENHLAAGAALTDVINAPLGADFYQAQQQVAEAYFAYVLPQIYGYAENVHTGADAILALPLDAF
ncbi:acyl-CoA dehydrogenase [Snodgrassella sp. CFCC 13594]|uniref:acyl-CoA dehydrogenase n=1 Tax=Snodgrassella sp. CFCC 13594 TaxID=1775559 RepID=UPI000835EB47|nr:acyl-CoA dehydrogenase [Snodgrassella sp. CFCC 13594]